MAHIQFKSFSKVLGMQMSLNIILPEPQMGIGVEAGAWNGKDKLPCLYLLHGMSDDETIWGRRTSLERYCSDKKIAIVMPTTHLAWYTNEVFGLPYFDYVAREVPEICETYFPISSERKDRFVAGLSMGGYGALKIGLRERHRFAALAAYSAGLGLLDRIGPEAERCPDIETLRQNQASIEPQTYQYLLRAYRTFGNPQLYRESVENNPELFTREAAESGEPLPKMLIACGTEDFLYDANVAYVDLLQSLGVEHEYHEEPGAHTWDFWDRWIEYTLNWLPLDEGEAEG